MHFPANALALAVGGGTLDTLLREEPSRVGSYKVGVALQEDSFAEGQISARTGQAFRFGHSG